MLAIAVAVVLLIACAAERHREISIRRALGASSARLARQIFTETALLASAGALLGCALAAAILRSVQSFWNADLNFGEIALDSQVLPFTLLLCCLICLICGLLPASAARKPDIESPLRQSTGQTADPASRSLSKALLCTEIALSVVLLVTAVSLFRSFLRILDVPRGFDPENTLVVRSTFNTQRYSSHEKRRAVENQILKSLRLVPGVSSTALNTHVPLADERQIGFAILRRSAQ